jgi:ribosomal protein S18 acetylase RimI-like enzyme
MLIELYDGDRAALTPLFRLADDSEQQIAAYRDQGVIYVARENGTITGHVQIVATSAPDTLEINSIAVDEARQGAGIGAALVRAAVEHCKAAGAARLIVATATAGMSVVRFYQRAGFRFCTIVRDAFSPEKGYPPGIIIDGIPLRDQIILDMALTEV